MMPSVDPTLLLSLAIRPAIVLFLGWAAIRILRRVSPRMRYDVAVMTMVAALMVPLAYWLLPSLNILPVGEWAGLQTMERISERTLSADDVASSGQPAAMGDVLPSRVPLDPAVGSGPDGSATVYMVRGSESSNAILEAVSYVVGMVRSLSIAQIVFLVWMAGMGLVIVRFAAARWVLGRLWLSATPYSVEAWQDAIDEAGDRVFLTRPLATREMAGIHSPMTWGVISPRLLLPVEAREWSCERKLNALMHEMVHVRRLDAVHDTLSALALALNWFNPLAWMMRAELKSQREASCDAEVLKLGAQPEEYARMLIDVAKEMRLHRSAPQLAMTIARPSQLEGRVLSVLNYKPGPSGPNNRWLVAGAMTFLMMFTSAAAPSHPASENSPVLRSDAAAPSAHENETSDFSEAAEWPSAPQSNTNSSFEPYRLEDLASTRIPENDQLNSEQAIGDFFAVTGIRLADAVLNELGASVERLDWTSILDDIEINIEGSGVSLDSLDLDFNGTDSAAVDAAMSRFSLTIQGAILTELEHIVREDPDSDKARRARKALLEMDSEASRDALKRLGIRPLVR